MGWEYSLDDLARFTGAEPAAAEDRFCRVTTDSRVPQEGAVFFALKGERFDGDDFVDAALENGAVAAVAPSDHNHPRCLVAPDPLEALQSFAAAHRLSCPAPVFAITGSCGKTTAKDLTAAVLGAGRKVVKTRGNLNNEIGTPLSLLEMDGDTDFGVFELGANHSGEIARMCHWVKPRESAITMIAPAHLEGFGSIDAVAQAKGEIVAALPSDGVFYANAGDPRCAALARRHPGEVIWFGPAGSAPEGSRSVTLQRLERTDEGHVLHIDPVGPLRLPMLCPAHAVNVLLAVAVGLRHGADAFEAPLREALQSASRFQLLRIGPLEVLDDAYNANPASVAAALEALAARGGDGVPRIAALGDMLELGPGAADFHRAAGHQAAEAGVTHLFALGTFASALAEGAREGGVPHAAVAEDHQAITEAVSALAEEGGVLLLKGSRGTRMETIIGQLKERFA